MPGRLHAKGRRSTRSRPYERRRRTRRVPRNQRGGENEGQTPTTWLAAAQKLHETANQEPVDFTSLRNQALSLTQGTGPALQGYTPPFLSDIIANIAVSLKEILQGQLPINSGAAFTAAMADLERYDNTIYTLIVRLETDLRREFRSQVLGRSGAETIGSVNLAAAPGDSRVPFVWIAFANLPEGQLEPRVPILITEIPPDTPK